MSDMTMDDVEHAIHNLILAIRSETKNSNPIAFMHGNASFDDLMDKYGPKEFGDWMFNNGFSTALTVVECYVRAMMDELGVSQKWSIHHRPD